MSLEGKAAEIARLLLEAEMDNPLWPEDEDGWEATVGELGRELEGAITDRWIEFHAVKAAEKQGA